MKNLKKGQLKFLDLTPTSAQRKKITTIFNKVLLNGNFILGKEVKNFEKRFAKYLRVKYCIGVGNGLEALQISLMALGVGLGDEVITTPISAVATTLAILAVGGKPTFVDTDENGLINVDLIEQSITKKTKAILPVHLYGNPVNLEIIKKICEKNNLFLIEDTAQAHGSMYNNRKLGSFGEINCFSFYPTKNLGAYGDGGAIVTNNRKLANICQEIRDYGQGEKYIHSRYGLNSRLDEIQAAILNLKLKSLDRENLKRQTLAKRYIKNLSQISNLEIVKTKNITDSNFHLFVIRTKKRDSLKKYLGKLGIQTSIHYPKTIPDQPLFNNQYKNIPIPAARNFVKQCLSLPLNSKMTTTEVDYICKSIKDFYSKN